MKNRAGLVALLSVLAACSTKTAGLIAPRPPASLPPHAATVNGPAVTGVVRDTDGRPVAGAAVRVEVEQSTAEGFVDAMKAISSVGIFCGIAGGCTPPSSSGYSARDGSFAVAVPNGNPGDDAYSVTVVAAHGELARVGTSLDLPRSTRHGFEIGTVVVAAGSPSTTKRGDFVVVNPPLLPAKFRPAAPSTGINDQTGSSPVVDGLSHSVTTGYNPLVIEDEHLLLTTQQSGIEHGHRALFSSSLAVHGNAVPVSRHSACWVEGSRGQRIAQHPCGLTDGVLDKAWQPKDDPRCSDGPCKGHLQHDHRDVTVELSRTIAAELIVVRGCSGCTVSTSGDGHGFTTVGTQDFGSPDSTLVATLHGQGVRMVRVQTDTGGFFDSLREVSVFSAGQHG